MLDYGNLTGGAAIPLVCWEFSAYNTESWPGSAGCGTSGTDYEADGSPPTLNATAGQYTDWDLPPEWVHDWRNGDNNGFIIFDTTGTGDKRIRAAGNPFTNPYWEVDYVPGHSHIFMGGF